MVDQIPQSRDGELVLPPGTYAYVLDKTKGRVSVAVGPYKNSLSNTDQLVAWDSNKRRYVDIVNDTGTHQNFAIAAQGQYIILDNPAPQGDHPPKGASTDAADLEVGRRVVVAGPAAFPLWPGQTAQTLDGHHLRHNQYVVVRVYDEQLARENFRSTVMAPQVKTDAPEGDAVPTLAAEAPQFTMGQLIIVPGTDVSFYMPSTGMEVVPEGGTLTADPRQTQAQIDRYVRNAVTLETLEYCILLDENGQKRYVRGPEVVFPHPTETFKVNENNSRVFDAIELNDQSGIYVKVIEQYTDEAGDHPVGEELFITGDQTAIYFPRAEHSIIMYEGKRKHHAIAVPAGEGRYLLDRTSGNVGLNRGPLMLLPDPRTEVIVRRILDPHDVELMFPGNQEALQVNAGYAATRQAAGSDYLENAEMRRSTVKGQRAAYAGNETVLAASASAGPQNFVGDTLTRGATFSPPRTVTLDTKYEGAVAVSIYPGYAVLITDKTGNRHVEVGPVVVLLEYDETIMALKLSTGRPKTDNSLLRTGYLRIVNNVVTDIVTVETRDLVKLDLEVSYRVNFIGESATDRERWFSVENYVQVLTDHCRSRLRNIAKQSGILEFYTGAIDIVRDTLLGTVPVDGDRPGLMFDENGMHVYDVEVLGVTIDNPEVEKLLTGAQSKAFTGAIELSIAQEAFSREGQLEDLKRKSMQEQQTTAKVAADIQVGRILSDLQRRLTETSSELQVREEQQKVEDTHLESTRKLTEQDIALSEKRDEVEIARLVAETSEFVRRLGALDGPLVASMQSLTDHALMEKIVTAIGPAALAAGTTVADILTQTFKGTPFESLVAAFADRPLALTNGQRQEERESV